MRTSYKKEEERSGVRLIALLENHLQDILSREADNRTFSRLSAPSHSLDGYREWHTEEVGDFPVSQTSLLLEN
ncbi:hypothetical protein [Parabacteroides distasonis]|uniref:hypothetical protein n=1 Tax=Parabacteroides distasonis TaxID=823 RepID=UPI00189CD7C6|nr:hypothetical protein [Parabacteroides distasonis]MDB9153396.1 hypothetical protein [Parabacteroides distasonis]MDB9157966.1 hypothetical protein [Parabacteroides distasonis]MDB9166831.1 hypothetical protein [Parabacteroides distasonis]MDB9171251.1 hypothetical protein [Parabacteroides distasonis]MDB9193587.1 hypothetical protein [Parabacteroides distasonis]